MVTPSDSLKVSSDLEVVTLTGGRPLAFSFCERWMADQTVQPSRWIVVDDVEEATTVTMGQTVIRPQPWWRPGDRTINRNLVAALSATVAPVVAIVEDDDHYDPAWMDTMVDLFDSTDALLIGEGWTRYYHILDHGWRENSNDVHASLCATAFRQELIPGILDLLADLPPGSPFLDGPIWQAFGDQGLILSSNMVTGIKGIPGRPGAGRGHNPDQNGYHPDNNRQEVLKSWIGEKAAALYLNRIKPPHLPSGATPPNMRPSSRT